MRCFYRMQNITEWTEGQIDNLNPRGVISFSNSKTDAIILSNTDIVFSNRGFKVYGYKQASGNSYELVFVEVVFRKPRD